MHKPGAPSSIVGVEQATVRRRCVPGMRRAGGVVVILMLVAAAMPLAAQERAEQVHRAREPEGRLLAYYSAAVLFTSLGAVASPARWSLGLEATLIPTLSEAQRRPGIDKPETTNLSPLLPRPRVTLRTRAALLEASWIPPIAVGDAKANLGAVAVSRELTRWRGVSLVPRLSAVAGRVSGAITCNASTAEKGTADLAVYYAAVCHGRDSDDWFEPRVLAAELHGSRAIWRERGVAWIAAGGRVDRSRFDIGVQRPDGTRDGDHPVLRLRDTRMHLTAGVRWPLHRRLVSAAEWFYAPGSMHTLRALVAVTSGAP